MLSEILKSGHEPYFWRTRDGTEVDFVIRKIHEGKECLLGIEVKLRWSKKGVPRGLKSFIEAYNPDLAIIVDLKPESWRVKVGPTTVKKLPLWELWGERIRWSNTPGSPGR